MSTQERSPLLSFTPPILAFLFNIRRASLLKCSHTFVALASYRFHRHIFHLPISAPFGCLVIQRNSKNIFNCHWARKAMFSRIVSAYKHSYHIHLHLRLFLALSSLHTHGARLRHRGCFPDSQLTAPSCRVHKKNNTVVQPIFSSLECFETRYTVLTKFWGYFPRIGYKIGPETFKNPVIFPFLTTGGRTA